jgi:hypothetical protein
VIAAIAAVLVAVGLLPAHAMPARQREIALAAR